jgi:hypothetical protein
MKKSLGGLSSEAFLQLFQNASRRVASPQLMDGKLTWDYGHIGGKDRWSQQVLEKPSTSRRSIPRIDQPDVVLVGS